MKVANFQTFICTGSGTPDELQRESLGTLHHNPARSHRHTTEEDISS